VGSAYLGNVRLIDAFIIMREDDDMGRFDGRVAIVTGSARGIGAGIAKRFAEEGAAVAVLDLDEEQAAATAKSLGGTAPAIGVGCNVSDGASVEAAVARIIEELGGVHILVNNAGITRDNLLFKLSEDDWDSVMNVHLKGAFLMSKAVQKTFVEQKYGKILGLSSVSANGNRGQANYSAAKAGVQGFTRTLALELGKFGVNVNAIAPGFIATEMTDDTARRLGVEVEEFRKMNAEANPVKRVGYPEDIAAAAAFLCSDEASYITGQTLYVDGGAKI
jgi:3-oxoacyl-[acyl-carrier protein] reductase